MSNLNHVIKNNFNNLTFIKPTKQKLKLNLKFIFKSITIIFACKYFKNENSTIQCKACDK